MAVLNSVEPAVAVSAEKEEFVATSWEGKEEFEFDREFADGESEEASPRLVMEEADWIAEEK